MFSVIKERDDQVYTGVAILASNCGPSNNQFPQICDVQNTVVCKFSEMSNVYPRILELVTEYTMF